MKRILTLAVAMLFASVSNVDRSWAVVATIPTTGIAATSVVVGAAATTEGSLEETRSKWNRKFLTFGGLLLATVDPDPATYLSGTSVIHYPEELLEFQQLTWFGPFSDMSTGEMGPTPTSGAVQGSGFTDDVQVFVPQGPNPDLSITSSVSGDGVLTVSWNADPGIIADSESANIFAAVFSSISEEDLFFEVMEAGNPLANFSQDTSAQSLTCIPQVMRSPEDAVIQMNL